MFRSLISLTVGSLLLASCAQLTGGSTPTTGPVVIETTTLARGVDSRITQMRRVAIKDDASWAALWREHGGSDESRAKVDFGKEMVLAAFTGTRPTSGYAVTIGSLNVQGDRVLVNARELAPEPGSINADVITTPYHIVKAPRRDETAVFIEAP